MILNVLVKPVWIFFIDRQVQNLVGHEAYGRYFAILNLSIVLFFLADAGFTSMINQRIAHRVHVNVKQLLKVKLLLLLVYALTCFLVAWLSGIRNLQLLAYVVIIQMLTSVFLFVRSIVTANQFFTADAMLSIMDKFLMVLICGAIIYTSFFGLIDLILFLQIQAACIALAVLTGFGFLFNKNIITAGAKDSAVSLLRLVLPFATIILLMSIHNRIDGFLLERIHPNGAYEAGIYAAAYRLLDAANMAGYLAGSFLVPFIARHQSENKSFEKVLLVSRHGLLFLSMAVVAFCFVFGNWIQQVLYHASAPYPTLIIQLCLASLPAYYIIHVYGALLTATGQLRSWIIILIVSATINLMLNFLMLKGLGAQGCCIAALVSQYFCALAVYIIASRNSAIALAGKWWIFYFMAAAVLAGTFYLGRQLLINVWIILAVLTVPAVSFLLMQWKFLKSRFSSQS